MSEKRTENSLGVFLNDLNWVKYFGYSGRNEGFVCNYLGSFADGNWMIVMTNGMSPSMLLNEIVCSIAILNDWKNYSLE